MVKCKGDDFKRTQDEIFDYIDDEEEDNDDHISKIQKHLANFKKLTKHNEIEDSDQESTTSSYPKFNSKKPALSDDDAQLEAFEKKKAVANKFGKIIKAVSKKPALSDDDE